MADRGSGRSPTSPVPADRGLDRGLGLDRGRADMARADRGRADMARADRVLVDRVLVDRVLVDLALAGADRGPGRVLVDLALAHRGRGRADRGRGRVLVDLALVDRGRADRGPGRVLADRGRGRRPGLSRTRRRELSIEATRKWAARQMRPAGSARMVMVRRLRRRREGSAGTMARLPVARRLTGKARRLLVAGTARRLPVGGTARGTAHRGI